MDPLEMLVVAIVSAFLVFLVNAEGNTGVQAPGESDDAHAPYRNLTVEPQCNVQRPIDASGVGSTRHARHPLELPGASIEEDRVHACPQ